MSFLTMRHDFRAPVDGSSSQAEIYSAAMDQFREIGMTGWLGRAEKLAAQVT